MTKTSEILKEAKRHLSRDQFMGICAAIDRVGYMDVYKAREARKLIEHRIYPFVYATEWLGWQMVKSKRKHPRYDNDWNVVGEWKNAQPQSKLQAWRHKWLDQLIDEFKRKGD